MNQHKALASFVVAAAVVVSACDAVTGASGGSPIGVGSVSARAKGTGFTTAPQIAFYRVSSASFISPDGIRDTCFSTAYSETGTSGTTTASALGAGAFITIALGNRVDTLVRTANTLDPVYRSGSATGIPYTPGDSMVITVPGDRNGFPTSVFRGRTAEAFTMVPLVVPANGNPINIQWTPATDANSAMFVNFRFASGTAGSYDRQIACSFVDDGSGQVPATVATSWIQATQRDMIAQRLRAILTQVDVPLAYLNVVSTFDWPTPVSP